MVEAEAHFVFVQTLDSPKHHVALGQLLCITKI